MILHLAILLHAISFNVLSLTLKIFPIASRSKTTIKMPLSPKSETTIEPPLSCPACFGDGYQLVDCTRCGGGCKQTNSEGDQVDCFHCGGTGCESIACNVCHGTGSVPNVPHE